MSILIRIPLVVENMSALAGYFTDGPNLAALRGLVSQLEDDAQFVAHRFGFVLESYEARHSEKLTTGLDATAKKNQSEGVRSGTGYRYANLRAALYLETDELGSEDLQDLLLCLEISLNGRRFQGGNLLAYVSSDTRDPEHISVSTLNGPSDRVAFVVANEKPLSVIYLSNHLPKALLGDELIEAFAQALVQKNNLMVCNGYVQVGACVDSFGQPQYLGEPSFTLAQALPVHELRKMDSEQQRSVFKRFFWAFDHALNEKSPTHFIIT